MATGCCAFAAALDVQLLLLVPADRAALHFTGACFCAPVGATLRQ
jgi:hypothetical protein